MSEAEVVEQLVNFTSVLLAGVSVLFTVVSAYVAALNYFIGAANLLARFAAFAFLTLILAMLTFVLLGAQWTQQGLIDRLRELQEEGGLTAAGRAVLANAAPEISFGGAFSIDDAVQAFSWAGLAVIYLSLFYLTFAHRWRPDVIPVSISRTDP